MVSVGNTCTVSMTAAKSVTATFNASTPTYTLTVAKGGQGSGTVTSNPAGISCGSDCTEPYTSGTNVTLSATPASGSTFAGWSGACTGTGSCVVGMTAAKNVTATFITYTSSPAAGSYTSGGNVLVAACRLLPGTLCCYLACRCRDNSGPSANGEVGGPHRGPSGPADVSCVCEVAPYGSGQVFAGARSRRDP